MRCRFGFVSAFGLSLLCLFLSPGCALTRTADEAKIGGGVKVSGLMSELIGVDVGFEVAFRKGRVYETGCTCVDTGDIRVPL